MRRTLMRGLPLTVLCIALQALNASWAGGLQAGTVTRVSDGDTVWIRFAAESNVSAKPRAVRLRGIDAPELCQAWGGEAKAALESRILHRQVTLTSHATDNYQRAVITLDLHGEDIAAWMVVHGHAWNATYRRHPGAYAAQERAARIARRGLFAQAGAMEPRAFRKAHGPCPTR